MILCLSFNAFSDDLKFFNKNLAWSKTLKQMKLSASGSDNSMCFEQNSKLYGVNTNKPLRIASLSKLYTSFWALKTLGEDHKFITEANYYAGSLHITSDDPLFNREHVFRIIRELNHHDIYKVKMIYLDKSLIWYNRNGAGDFLGHYSFKKNSYYVGTRLKKLFNLNVSKRSGYYSSFLKWINPQDPEHKEKYPSMSLVQVSYTQDNPFGEKSQLKITLESKTLKTYLKMMNAKSKNSLADHLFDNLGGRDAFHEFINLELNTDQDSINFYTGSGLNLDLPNGRKDNLSTCELSIDLIKKVSEFLSAVEIEDIMDYAPHKEGTLGGRFEKYNQLKQAVAGKTGTLNQMPAYVLGGVLSGKLEKMPFVIINQPKTRLKLTSRKFQEIMLHNLSKMTGMVALEDVERIESSFVESYSSEVPQELLALTNPHGMLH